MKAHLEAEVKIWDIDVFAELGVWETRPELQLLCGAAYDLGCSLDEALVKQRLPGLSTRAYKNLLRHLEHIQLISQTGALTSFGLECAVSGKAPSWEQGAYRLLIATHPLFEHRVLAFKRVAGDGQDRDFDNLEVVPSWLTPSCDQVFTSVFDEPQQFSIVKFPSAQGQSPVCRMLELQPGKLNWEIDLKTGSNQWSIEGTAPKAFRSQPESVNPQDLVDLYPTWERRWDTKRSFLAMAYDGKAAVGGQESFLRAQTYKNKKVGRFGSYEEVSVSDIPVGPATDGDARIWATALLISRLEADDNYVSQEAWRAGWSDTIKGTPLAGGAGSAPDPLTIDSVHKKSLSARTRWLLSAASDIGMEV